MYDNQSAAHFQERLRRQDEEFLTLEGRVSPEARLGDGQYNLKLNKIAIQIDFVVVNLHSRITYLNPLL